MCCVHKVEDTRQQMQLKKGDKLYARKGVSLLPIQKQAVVVRLQAHTQPQGRLVM